MKIIKKFTRKKFNTSIKYLLHCSPYAGDVCHHSCQSAGGQPDPDGLRLSSLQEQEEALLQSLGREGRQQRARAELLQQQSRVQGVSGQRDKGQKRLSAENYSSLKSKDK